MRLISLISSWLARLAAWLFVATGAMLTFEVVARYVFSAPTIWAAEVSQLFMMIGVFIALSGGCDNPCHQITTCLAVINVLL